MKTSHVLVTVMAFSSIELAHSQTPGPLAWNPENKTNNLSAVSQRYTEASSQLFILNPKANEIPLDTLFFRD